MFMFATFVVLEFLLGAIIFWCGITYGQYKYEPPECPRRHRDEL